MYCYILPDEIFAVIFYLVNYLLLLFTGELFISIFYLVKYLLLSPFAIYKNRLNCIITKNVYLHKLFDQFK